MATLISFSPHIHILVMKHLTKWDMLKTESHIMVRSNLIVYFYKNREVKLPGMDFFTLLWGPLLNSLSHHYRKQHKYQIQGKGGDNTFQVWLAVKLTHLAAESIRLSQL